MYINFNARSARLKTAMARYEAQFGEEFPLPFYAFDDWDETIPLIESSLREGAPFDVGSYLREHPDILELLDSDF